MRSDTESLLAEVIEHYLHQDEDTRQAIRELFARNRSFARAAILPFPPTTPDRFRSHLISLSINDQGLDTRDTILSFQTICAEASSAGVATAPVLRAVAALSSDEDKYGMGSTRSLLLK